MCLGKAVDKLPGAKPPGTDSEWIPTVGESVDPHYMRTNAKAEERHKKIGIHQPEPPPPPELPTPPQSAKPPDTQPLRRRRNGMGGPATSDTLLTGPSGITAAQLQLGGSTLLGG